LQDNLAVRATLGVSNNSETINHYELANNGGGVGTEINKSSDWGLAVGAEYHFDGTDKLSPYAGIDIMFGGGNDRAEWDKYDGTGYAADVTAEVSNPTSMIGVNLVAGTDYYFAENFYLGLELGLGWYSWTDKEGVSSVTVAGTTTETKTPDSKESYMGNNVIGTFRLGWRF
jgi:outer membrane protein W